MTAFAEDQVQGASDTSDFGERILFVAGANRVIGPTTFVAEILRAGSALISIGSLFLKEQSVEQGRVVGVQTESFDAAANLALVSSTLLRPTIEDEEVLAAAEAASERLESRVGEDIETWAEDLADDLTELYD